MVPPLVPAKFYGSSLPRPRFYTDVTLSDDRVDPPVSVLDPLLSWASEAPWSVGGLSLNRVRFQGKIEGNLDKLRTEDEDEKGECSTVFSKSNEVSCRVLKRKRRRLVRKIGDEIELVGKENGESLSDGGVSCSVASTTRRNMVLIEEE